MGTIVGKGIISAGGASGLNIAYGLTPPHRYKQAVGTDC